MLYRITIDAPATVGTTASRTVRPCRATRSLARTTQIIDFHDFAKRSAAAMFLSAGVLSGVFSFPAVVIAADVAQPHAATTVIRRPPSAAPLRQISPPPLASTAAAAASAVATAPSAAAAVMEVVEEAEELVMDVVHFLQHSVEAVETTVHHLQVFHALEQLEGLPLSEVVDLELLKAAMHPANSSYGMDYDYEEDDEAAVEQPGAGGVAAAADAARRLDAALDSVADWRLRDVVDVGRLADALQDVQYSGPFESRALQREAPRLRRAVHWEAVAEAVRPPALRQALSAMGAAHGGRGGGSAFSELDIRAAFSAVRMDAVRQVLAPPKSSPQQLSHGLESSGMWTWDSM